MCNYKVLGAQVSELLHLLVDQQLRLANCRLSLAESFKEHKMSFNYGGFCKNEQVMLANFLLYTFFVVDKAIAALGHIALVLLAQRVQVVRVVIQKLSVMIAVLKKI
jgi:hypothetical protein